MGNAAHPSDEHMSHADSRDPNCHEARQSSTTATVAGGASTYCRGHLGLRISFLEEPGVNDKTQGGWKKTQTYCYATPLHFGSKSFFSQTFKTLIRLFTKLFWARVIIYWIFDPHAADTRVEFTLHYTPQTGLKW